MKISLLKNIFNSTIFIIKTIGISKITRLEVIRFILRYTTTYIIINIVFNSIIYYMVTFVQFPEKIGRDVIGIEHYRFFIYIGRHLYNWRGELLGFLPILLFISIILLVIFIHLFNRSRSRFIKVFYLIVIKANQFIIATILFLPLFSYETYFILDYYGLLEWIILII
ncbi:hypothetical protein (mitochondrion) [Myxobolus squamalis]|uniref:Uncharacterized protein n=1 Tax=Myxobolus squamalis TaxID=59785 RepID=A0A678XI40_MYXSQ|nr:hypothetical protein [Myxobolus squamalis]